MEVDKTLINNRTSNLQKDFEEIDKEKTRQLNMRDEMARIKSKKITETGQILMTIDNLYKKCQLMNEIFPRPADYRQFESNVYNNFDNSQNAGEKAAA